MEQIDPETLHQPPDHRVRSFRLEAVVLRHNDWGEADRMISLYSLEMGKIRVLAKGVRKPRSRKAGHLEPFIRASLQLARGREILLVTQAETIEPYTALRDDLMLTTYAAYAVELLDRFTYEEGENRAIYHLLVDTLGRLNSTAVPAQAAENKLPAEAALPVSPELILRYYEMRLLDYLGFRPLLFKCASCGEEIQPQDQYFSADAGGVICPKCASRYPTARQVSMQALKYMRHFQRSSFADAKRAQPSTITSREIESLMQYYLTYLLERGLNSPAFLRRLRQQKAGNE